MKSKVPSIGRKVPKKISTFSFEFFALFVSLREVKDIAHNLLRFGKVSRLQNKQKYANFSQRLIINSLNLAAMEIERKH